uniref:cGMP-dependent protein kinase interacting domain-containing protein n=1 Tax=Glossina austeni TaxID=7395 RepID=A0A1A9UZG9_GLOAU
MKPSKEDTTRKAKKSLKPSELKRTHLKELQKNSASSESAKAAPKTVAATPKELVNTETQTDRDLNDNGYGLESVNNDFRKTIENSEEKLSRKEDAEGKSLSSLGQIKLLKKENDVLKEELKIVREKYKVREMKIQEALRHLRCVNSIKPLP